MIHSDSSRHDDRSWAKRLVAVAFSLCAMLWVAAPPALGDSATTPSDQAPGVEDPLQTFRAPLLREGSMLVEAHVVLRRQGEPAWWTVHVEPRDASTASSGVNGGDLIAATTVRPLPANELVVLPCTRLSEMERIIESASVDASREVHFKVSGRVYVFRDRNYFLPTHAAVVSAESVASTTPAPTAEATTPTSAPNAAIASPPADEDSAEAIARALEQQAGPIARSSAATRAAESNLPTGADGGSTRDLTASARRASLQENTAVVNRRGKITRDRSGGWLLVFDADASGLADPPLKLMPCMLLENIEDYARRAGNNSPIIVTGQVYLYNNQNHLLPTVYRIPRETSRLTP